MKRLFTIVILSALMFGLSLSSASANGHNYHTVKHGETLFSIGRMYGVAPHAIAQANALPNPNLIHAGQKLHIPASTGYHAPAPQHPQHRYHTVKHGETLSQIAYHYGTTVHAIAQANSIYNVDHIYVGQHLHIPAAHHYGHHGGQHGHSYPHYNYSYHSYPHYNYGY